MKTFGIVYAEGGEEITTIEAETMEDAMITFSKQMPQDLYKSLWIFSCIGTAPYIVTDTMIEITACEY